MEALSLTATLDADLQAYERQELLRLVVVGSVDDGKSTLIGRLLYETQALYDDQVSQVRRASKGGGEIDYALFTDGLRAEREQGITIDVAYRYFSTARRKYIVADTPGHAQYTRNMATGASTAELGIILLDARLGVLPQSRRHAYIASLLGIPHLLVAVNKMDLVGYEEATFQRHAEAFRTFAAKLGFSSVTFIPVCAREGDNVVTRSPRLAWYRGETLLELLETVPALRVDAAAPLRLPVQYVLRPDLKYRGFAGQLASGSVRPGSEIVVLPSGQRTRVLAVDSFEGELPVAFAPSSVALRLMDEIDISRGDLIAEIETPPTVATEIEAMLVWFGEQPLDPTRAYLIKHTTRLVPAQTLRPLWTLDLETLSEVADRGLAMNEIGRVSVRLKRPLVVDLYAQQAATGAFIVIDALTNATVGAGMIVGIPAASGDDRLRVGSNVGAEERYRRLGHHSAVVGLRGDRASAVALAAALERALFDSGTIATVVETQDGANACAAAGLVAILVPSSTAVDSSIATQRFIEIRASTAVDSALRQILDALDSPERC